MAQLKTDVFGLVWYVLDKTLNKNITLWNIKLFPWLCKIKGKKEVEPFCANTTLLPENNIKIPPQSKQWQEFMDVFSGNAK